MNILRPAGSKPLAEGLRIRAKALGPVTYEEEEWCVEYQAEEIGERVDLYTVVEDALCEWRYPDPKRTKAWFLLSIWTGSPVFSLLLEVAPFTYSAAVQAEILQRASRESWFPDSHLPEERACSDYALWVSEFAACDAQSDHGGAMAEYPLALTSSEQRLLLRHCLCAGDADAHRALRQVLRPTKNLF